MCFLTPVFSSVSLEFQAQLTPLITYRAAKPWQTRSRSIRFLSGIP